MKAYTTHFKVGRPSSEEDVVGMPVQGGDGRTNWLLDVLAHPPVILLLKVANANQACPRTNRKLIFCNRKINKNTVSHKENSANLDRINFAFL